MFFAELACVKETRDPWQFYPIPIESFVERTRVFSRIPLLELVTLPPRSCENIHPTSGNPIPTDIGSEYILDGLFHTGIPHYKCLVPSSTVDEVLMGFICVKFGTINSIWVRIVGGIRLLQFKYFFSLDLIKNSHHWLASTSNQFGSIIIKIQAVKLLINHRRIILHGAETFARVQMPVLNFAISIGGCENITSFEVFVFWSPCDIWKRNFSFTCYCGWDWFIFDIVYLNCAVVSSWH